MLKKECKHTFVPIIRQAITADEFESILYDTPMFLQSTTRKSLIEGLFPRLLGTICSKCGRVVRD